MKKRGTVKGARKHAQIVRLFNKGWTLGSIARSLDVFTTQVTQVLELEGLRAPKVQPKRDLREERQIARLYSSGARSGELARKFKTSGWRVRRIVRSAGQSLARRGNAVRQFTQADALKMASLWRAGVAQVDIAAEFKTHQTTVSRVLQSSGLDLESKWRKADGRALMKGGRSNAEGYWRVLIGRTDPMASMCNSAGYVLEHRLVMARKLKRPLRKNETVHHIDGDKTNNKLSNLQLRQGRHGKHECHVCLDCGSRNIGNAPI